MSSNNVPAEYIYVMANITKFKERFTECLKYSGVKQSELAAAANVTKQFITDYKYGRSVPSTDTLCLICKFSGVSADYLLGLTD